MDDKRRLEVLTVDAATVEQYRADGATVVRGAVSTDRLGRLAEAIERDIASPGPFDHSYDTDGARFHGNLRIWQNDPEFAAFCTASVAPSIAQQCLGSERINLLYDQLFVKEPGANRPTRWHNDQPYWPISGRQVISIWVALDPTTEENGRLEFVRGSHLWDRWFQPEEFGPSSRGSSVYDRNPAYEPMLDIDAQRDQFDIISWDLEPGDVYVFNAMTVHGASGNQSADVRRRGYTVRYTGDDVVYDPRVGTSKPLWSDVLSAGDRLDSAQYPLVIGD